MRELTPREVEAVSGGLAAAIGRKIGIKLGYLHNRINERVHNAPFQRVYRTR